MWSPDITRFVESLGPQLEETCEAYRNMKWFGSVNVKHDIGHEGMAHIFPSYIKEHASNDLFCYRCDRSNECPVYTLVLPGCCRSNDFIG